MTWGLLCGLVSSTLAGTIEATTSEATNEAEYVKGFLISGSKRLDKQWAASRPGLADALREQLPESLWLTFTASQPGMAPAGFGKERPCRARGPA